GIAENPLRPDCWQKSCGTLRTFVGLTPLGKCGFMPNLVVIYVPLLEHPRRRAVRRRGKESMARRSHGIRCCGQYAIESYHLRNLCLAIHTGVAHMPTDLR